MKKTILITIILFSYLFFGENILVQASNFSDVPISHPYLEAIEYVRSQGIVKGYGDETYKPDQTITRAEFTKILLEAQFGAELQNCTEKYFSDVNESQWYAKYICFAKKKSIIQGYDNGTFEPNTSITFAEATKIISIAFGDTVEVDNTIWYKPYVENLENKKAIPSSIGEFKKNITRAEMAEIIYRLKANIQNKDSLTYEEIKLVSDWLEGDGHGDRMQYDWYKRKEKIKIIKCNDSDEVSYRETEQSTNSSYTTKHSDNPFERGTVTATFIINNKERIFNFTDYNVLNDSIMEYICWETSEPGFAITSEVIKCNNGRENGNCVIIESNCKDSDPEDDIYVKGSVKGLDNNGKDFFSEDECEDVTDGKRSLTIVNQVHCVTNNYSKGGTECVNGCIDGVCIKEDNKVNIEENDKKLFTYQTQPTTPVPVVQTPAQPIATQQSTTSSTNETASWQTYSNAKYGFEFKYPTNWTYKLLQDGNEVSFSPVGKTFYLEGSTIGVIRVVISDVKFDENNFKNLQKIQLDGKTGYKNAKGFQGEIDICFNLNNVPVSFTNDVLPVVINSEFKDKVVEYNTIYDKILSTLKFTK